MIDCQYIGDSIAVGLQQLDHKCEIHAKVGASTDYIVKQYSKYGPNARDYVVISMGSNGPYNPSNLANARKLRRNIEAAVIVWILPYNPVAAGDIKLVAREFGDSYVELKSYPTRDHIHPSYRPVAREIQETLDEVFN